MKVAIIGAAGFVGRHVQTMLEAQGQTCLASDVMVPHDLKGRVSILNIAHESPDWSEGIDAAVYLAQYPGYRDFPTNGGELFAVNVAGALRAADAARAAGAKAFLYASTGTVYAPTFKPMAETNPIRRDQPYALSKVQAEEALALLTGMATCCVRLFGVFGEDQKTMLVPALSGRIGRGEAVTLEANPMDASDMDGLQIALTHVSDVCSVISKLLDRMHAGVATPRILNVANPDALSIRALATAIASQLGVEPKFDLSATKRTSDYIADMTLMNSIVPHSFLTLDTAIERTFAAAHA
jgi:nucleoside-diphosphate-sugar epimerase